MASLRSLPAVLVLAAAAGGCTSIVTVKKDEIVKISGAHASVAAVPTYGAWDYGWRRPGYPMGGPMGPSYGVITAVPMTNLETTDGRIETLPATSDFDLVFKDGRTLTFEHPIEATIEGQNLLLASRNRARATYPLEAISHAEFTKVESGKTTALLFGVTFGVAVVAVGTPILFR